MWISNTLEDVARNELQLGDEILIQSAMDPCED